MLRNLLRLTLASVLLSTFMTLPLLADPGSPFTITNTDTPDPVASGAEITYTIFITNTGGASQSGVVMTDQLNGVGGIGVPPQLQITSSRGSCTQTTTLVTCSAGTMEGRGTWTITVRGIVVAPSGTVINNTASVASNKQPQGATSPATATTLVMGGTGGGPLPDLTISKNGPTAVAVSSAMTYTLTINNIGTANATGIKVTDTLPDGLTGATASGTSLFTCAVTDYAVVGDQRQVTCTGGAVNFGSNATVTINATSPSVAGTITNTASVDPDNTIAEGNELNNTSALVNTSVAAPPPLPPLSIELTDDPSVLAGAGPDPVIPGATLTYQILVKNNSPYRADDVNIVDGTQGLVASSISATFIVTDGTIGNFGGCSVNGSQAKCVAATLQSGGTILMTISGQVIASAGSTLLNTGTVSGTIKNKGQNATDSEITTVKPGIDLTITKSDSPDPVCAHSWPAAVPPPTFLPSPVCLGGLTYTFVVGNSGIQTASNVLVRDPLPPNTIFDSFTAPAFSGCGVDANNVLTCTGGTIGPESTTTITIVLVAPPGIGTINNTVYVDPNNAIFEADEANNTASTSTLVSTGIDLTIRKEQNFNPIATSGTETYTITVDNVGPQDATNIRVRDFLPANTIFRTASGDHGFTCSYVAASHTVECAGGSILGTESEFYGHPPAEDHAVIKIVIFAQPIIGTMHNEVRVDPDGTIAEVDESNNIATLDTTVTTGGAVLSAFNQFTISKKQDSPANPVARNAKVQYTITVGNDGTDPATGVVVRDFLPAGSTYIEATGTNHFNCSQVSSYINCVGGELAAGGTATITVTMFAPDTPGTYTNQAIVDPDSAIPEGNEFDNQASVQTVVENAGNGPFYELNIKKEQTSPDKTNTARNAIVTYKITVGNTGSDPVNSIAVRDTLPAGARYIEATGDHQFLCLQAVVGTVNCTGGQLLSGDSAIITLTMFAPDTPGTYVNQVFVDPDNTIPEGDELNNQATETTTVNDGGLGAFNDLTITKLANVSDINPGGEIVYTLTVSNLGSDPAQNVAVRDVLPAGETFVSAKDTGAGAAFTCNFGGGVVNCTGATVGGLPRTITIVVKAPQELHDALHPLHNEAAVDPDNTIPEGNESNNTSSADVTVSSLINLTVSKSGPTTASQSDVTDYTIKVKNNKTGPGQVATGVVMIDPLPVGLIPLATDLGTGNNWACSIDQNPINQVTCIGDLGPDEEVTIKITVFITAENGRTLDNVACVDPNNTIVESNELDNCSDAGTFVTPPPPTSPDLLVSKQVDSLSTSPGASLTYTINVSNSGDAHALGWNEDMAGHLNQGITVTDTLPSELTFVNFSTTNGFTCTESSGTITCHDDGTGMDPGASAQITINVTVKTDANSPITNTAHADPAIAFNCSGTCENESGPKLDNNNSTITSSIGSTGIDLAIGAITDVPDPVGPGQGLKYTITAVNGGTAPAIGVVIHLDIPTAGVNNPAAAGSNGFNCSAPSGGSVNCTGDLPAGGTTVITVTMAMDLTGLPPDVSLTATIDPSPGAFTETNEGNNTMTQTTTVSTSTCAICVDLVSSQLVASPEPLSSGGTLTLQYQVVNTGDTPTTLNPSSDTLLSLIGVTDGAFGAGATVASPDNTQWPCTIGQFGGLVAASCKGNLNPGQGITITVTIPNVTGTGVTVSGFADPSGLITEPNESNNNITQTVVIN